MKKPKVIFFILAAAIVQINAQTADRENNTANDYEITLPKSIETKSMLNEQSHMSIRTNEAPTAEPKRYLGNFSGSIKKKEPNKFADFRNLNLTNENTEPKEGSDKLSTRPKQSRYVRPTAKQRFSLYRNKIIGTGLVSVGVGAVVKQITNEPEEWMKTGGGFARRLASEFGEKAIRETVAYGVEEGLKLDSRYFPSTKTDTGSRVKHALISGVTAIRPDGKRVFNPAPIVGYVTAGVVSREAWYPQRYSYKDGLRSATRGIGFSIAFGLVSEFLFN